MPLKNISLHTAMSLVIANMIGTGVFTSLGFQVVDIQSIFVLLMLWVIGGITAFCGALTYGELGATFPRSGGEYNFLSKAFHPAVGFIGGWVSASVGFAAPTALVAMTFGEYTERVFPTLDKTALAVGLLIFITAIHATSVQHGGRFQRVFTLLKILLILAFIVSAFTIDSAQPIHLLPQEGDWELLTSPAFAVSLVYVSYSYTGWNAAAYIIDELQQPQRNLPIALAGGTMIVMVLYVLLNYAFLYTAPIPELSGQVEVGYISSYHIFGNTGGAIMAIVLALLLISTASAMIFAGPRVLQVMGEDFPLFGLLSKKNKHGAPSYAVLFQSLLSLGFILTASFEKVLVYAGFVLAITTFFTVLAVFVLRWKYPTRERPYKTWGYPLTPFIYLVLIGWTLVFLFRDKPQESLLGLVTLGIGLVLYFIGKTFDANTKGKT